MPDSELDAYCTANQDRFVSELMDALRIPSISANPDHAGDVRRSAEFFAQSAALAGFERAEVLETV